MSKDINWNEDSLKKLMAFEEGQLKITLEDQETSSFPDGEEAEIQSIEGRIDLLRDMMDMKSWKYRNYHNK